MTDNEMSTIAVGGTIKAAFADWRLSMSGLFDAELLNADHDHDCPTSFAAYNAGPFLIIFASAPPAILRRTSRQIVAGGVDHLVLQLNVSGECSLQVEGRLDRAGPGDMLCMDLSREIISTTTKLSIIDVIVPRRRVRLPPNILDMAHGAIVRGTTGIGVVLERHLSAIGALAPNYTGSDAGLIAEIVDTLVTVGVSSAIAGRSQIPAELLSPSLQSIKEYIERSLSDISLTPEAIGRHFGLSRSALYRLFKPLGGVAEYIRERRLQKAALHIASMEVRRGAIAKLARQCGFLHEAAFSRAFQSRFGRTPTDAVLWKTHFQVLGTELHQTPLRAWLQQLSLTTDQKRDGGG